MKCQSCGFETDNKKSMSNHLRYGCQFSELGCYPSFKERKKIDEEKRWKKYGKRYHEVQKTYLKSEKGKNMMRKRNQKFAENNPERKRLYHKVWYAGKTGKLERKPCEICGNLKSQAHHPNYTKPLEVVWLCLKHHRKEEGVWKGIYATI